MFSFTILKDLGDAIAKILEERENGSKVISRYLHVLVAACHRLVSSYGIRLH